MRRELFQSNQFLRPSRPTLAQKVIAVTADPPYSPHPGRTHPLKVQTSPGGAAGLAMAPHGGDQNSRLTTTCRHFVALGF